MSQVLGPMKTAVVNDAIPVTVTREVIDGVEDVLLNPTDTISVLVQIIVTALLELRSLDAHEDICTVTGYVRYGGGTTVCPAGVRSQNLVPFAGELASGPLS